MIDLFTCDYIEYDKYGLKEIRCMASGTPIKTRMEEVSKLDPSKIIYVMGQHPEFRSFPVLMKDDSVAFIMVSDKYENVEIGEKEAERISTQILRAKRIELESHGFTKDIIESELDNAKERKQVIRRLTLEEIRKRFGGDK
jgi:hypothetical protein